MDQLKNESDSEYEARIFHLEEMVRDCEPDDDEEEDEDDDPTEVEGRDYLNDWA